jgi:hypothetical protein
MTEDMTFLEYWRERTYATYRALKREHYKHHPPAEPTYMDRKLRAHPAESGEAYPDPRRGFDRDSIEAAMQDADAHKRVNNPSYEREEDDNG